jgi:hypothetical protein
MRCLSLACSTDRPHADGIFGRACGGKRSALGPALGIPRTRRLRTPFHLINAELLGHLDRLESMTAAGACQLVQVAHDSVATAPRPLASNRLVGRVDRSEVVNADAARWGDPRIPTCSQQRGLRPRGGAPRPRKRSEPATVRTGRACFGGIGVRCRRGCVRVKGSVKWPRVQRTSAN